MILDHIGTSFLGGRLIRESELYASIYGSRQSKYFTCVSTCLELVDKFCYLDNILSVDGEADAAVEARIQIGWNKFRQLVPLVTSGQ